MNVQRKVNRAKTRGRPAKAASGVTAVQPHGLLLVLDAETLAVKHVSANCDAFLGHPPAKILGSGIADHVDADYARTLAAFGAGDARTAGPSGPVTLRGPAPALGWRAASHRTGSTITVEIAPVPEGSPDLDGFLTEATAALRTVRDHAGIDATATTVARRLREMTGYERVMVVRFDDQGHSEIIAESKTPSAGSSLQGMHLLADTMPAPARAFALQNPIRMMHDLTAAPVPVVPPIDASGHAPELSEAILRAAPPIQVQLLAGMGARAALLMSLVRDRRLWGLVVFLHRDEVAGHEVAHGDHADAPRRRLLQGLSGILSR